ncbi:hypothetical protein [Pseudomonas glycinae]|uniref:hypothetical protein n=1 Tax=Pseudomonas glycinae TaxID=1785145 RepID=UPI001F2B22AF|nr:hypothetical protein [Pseudomonas glycinae]
MHTSAPKPPLSSWLVSLTVFVSSNTNLVYPNGRQQLEVMVLVEPLMSQTISPEELASTRLLARDAQGRFSPLPEGEELDSSWFFSHQRNRYIDYPGSRSISVPVDPPSVYSRKFYVSAGKTDGNASRMEKLYVGITRHMGQESHDYVTDGSETGFNVSAEVRTADIPQFQVPGNYLFERTLIAGNGNSDIFTWLYALAGANVQQQVVGFHCATMEADGMIQWDDKDPSVTRASHVGYSKPGETTLRYNSAIELGNVFQPVMQVSNPKQNHVMLVLQGSNVIPYHSESAIHHNGPCVLSAVDVYGNDHRLQIRFKDTSPQGRRELVLF